MKIIVCLDDNNGMLFNKRRQSKDRILCREIFSVTQGTVLWVHPYSEPLFADLDGEIQIDDRFMELAKPGEYCFVENLDVTPYICLAQEIIIFRWNRVYPADLRFPALPSQFQKTESREFAGSSHEKITMEVYRK